MSSIPNVLIVNSQNWLGLARLPAMIARAGCHVTLLGLTGGAISRSRHVAEKVFTPEGVPQVLDGLRDHLQQNPGRYRWVIFGDEPGLIAAAERRDEAWLRPWLPADPSNGALDVILSKAPFAQACQAKGVPIPRTIVCRGWDEVEAAAKEMGYPLILKNPTGSSGLGVKKVNKPEDLRAAFEPWANVAPLMIQQLMTGRLGATELLYDHGQLKCWFASYLAGCWPGPFGPSSIREVMVHPKMEPLLKRLGEVTGFHGLCGIDWFHDARDDSLAVLELNPRPTPCYHLGSYAGVDFAQSVRGMMLGDASIQRPVDNGKPLPSIHLFPQHILRCLDMHEPLGLFRWVPFVANHDIPWNEPVILTRQCLRICKLAVKYTLRKKAVFHGGDEEG